MSRFSTFFAASLCTFSLTSLVADEVSSLPLATEEIALPVVAADTSSATLAAPVQADAKQEAVAAAPAAPKAQEIPVSPFTGKVKAKKVRLRLKADLDSQVIRELGKNDLLSIVAEKGDFWVVQAPAGIKAYVFRSFVLDNVVEGNRVNVRLNPALDAPVIAHLNAGDKIQGNICAANNKWLEIAPPAQTKFYVAKEYIENAGGPEVMAQTEKRRTSAHQLFESATALGKAELKKAFADVDIDRPSQCYKTIINDYTDFPEYVEQAKEALAGLQEAYLQKRISGSHAKATSLDEDFSFKKEERTSVSALDATDKMKMWEPIEDAIYLSWTSMNEEQSIDQFYDEQKLTAATISGMLEAYSDPVRNKPGDFIVRQGELPVAYVYSTSVNLQNLVGKKVTLVGTPRPNNNFAFPAFYVLSAE